MGIHKKHAAIQKQQCIIDDRNEWEYTHNNQHPPARLFCGRKEKMRKQTVLDGRRQRQTEQVDLFPQELLHTTIFLSGTYRSANIMILNKTPPKKRLSTKGMLRQAQILTCMPAGDSKNEQSNTVWTPPISMRFLVVSH